MNNQDKIINLPIFPLKTVLFPQGPLPLKIFEPRYLDMLTDCEKTNCGFGVCLIKKGSEVGVAPEIHSVGTLVKVTYWEKRDDGLLGITVKGEQKYRIINSQISAKQLTMATVELIKPEPYVELPEQYNSMATVLKNIFSRLTYPYKNIDKYYDDASWVGSRLGELLPLPLLLRQQLLELQDPRKRLAMLYEEMLNLKLLSE